MGETIMSCKIIDMSIKELLDHRRRMARNSKRESCRNLARFLDIFPVFLKASAEREEPFTREELRKFEYYDYLVSRLHPKHRDPITKRGERHVRKIMLDGFYLYRDIKKNGLKNPLQMYQTERGIPRMSRGGRRLMILDMLGYKTVPVMMHDSRQEMLDDKTDWSWKKEV